MATYTQLNHKQIQKLAEQYDLDVTSFTPLQGGNANSSYILKCEQTMYVLTVCDEKTFESAERIAQVLMLLGKNNIPTSRLVLTKSNALLTSIDSKNGAKPVMLKSYIEGLVQSSLSESMLMQLGRQIANIYSIPAPSYLPIQLPFGKQCFNKVAGLNIDSDYESWLLNELKEVKQIQFDKLPKGLIHGDIFYDNVIFSLSPEGGGRLKAIIDFEDACQYTLAFDLGMTIVGCCTQDTLVDLGKVQALIKGYEAVRPLQEMERQSLQGLIRYAAAATSYWRFNQYNIDEPAAAKSALHWQMVEVANNVKKIDKNQFLISVDPAVKL